MIYFNNCSCPRTMLRLLTCIKLIVILGYLHFHRLRQHAILQRLLAVILLLTLSGFEWRAIRRYANRIRQREPPLLLLAKCKHHNQTRRYRRNPPRPTLAKFSAHLELMTGISRTFFFEIHDHLVAKQRLQTSQALTSELKLLLVLNWLREMPKLSTVGQKFEVSKSMVSTTINSLIYDLREVLQDLAPISLPSHWTKHRFEDVVGAVDCTSHYRCRVHPGQACYYRGDKHGHFLTAQVCAIVIAPAMMTDHYTYRYSVPWMAVRSMM